MSRFTNENELSDFEVIFIDKWFSNGFNASAAYRELKQDIRQFIIDREEEKQ